MADEMHADHEWGGLTDAQREWVREELAATTTVAEDAAVDLRCTGCKGPVHRRLDGQGWWCVLCGGTETFALADRGYQACGAKGCEFGWIQRSGHTCRKCGGKGLEVARG